MSYESWLTDSESDAKKKLADAKKAVKITAFSRRLYNAMLAISANDRFSYQVATDFEFNRIMNSKEFSDDEKATIKPFIEEYKKLNK